LCIIGASWRCFWSLHVCATRDKSPSTHEEIAQTKLWLTGRPTGMHKYKRAHLHPQNESQGEKRSRISARVVVMPKDPALGLKGSSQISYSDCNTWMDFGDWILSRHVNWWNRSQCHSHVVECSRHSVRLDFSSELVPFPHQIAMSVQCSQYPHGTPSARTQNSSCAPHGHMDFWICHLVPWGNCTSWHLPSHLL
jgi:hypothetical protein